MIVMNYYEFAKEFNFKYTFKKIFDYLNFDKNKIARARFTLEYIDLKSNHKIKDWLKTKYHWYECCLYDEMFLKQNSSFEETYAYDCLLSHYSLEEIVKKINLLNTFG